MRAVRARSKHRPRWVTVPSLAGHHGLMDLIPQLISLNQRKCFARPYLLLSQMRSPARGCGLFPASCECTRVAP